MNGGKKIVATCLTTWWQVYACVCCTTLGIQCETTSTPQTEEELSIQNLSWKPGFSSMLKNHYFNTSYKLFTVQQWLIRSGEKIGKKLPLQVPQNTCLPCRGHSSHGLLTAWKTKLLSSCMQQKAVKYRMLPVARSASHLRVWLAPFLCVYFKWPPLNPIYPRQGIYTLEPLHL